MEEKPRPLREKCGIVHEIPERPVRNRPERAISALQIGRNRPKLPVFCRKLYIFRLFPERPPAELRPNPRPTEQQVRDMLAGNRCHCTGHRGMVDAALAPVESGRLDARPAEAAR